MFHLCLGIPLAVYNVYAKYPRKDYTDLVASCSFYSLYVIAVEKNKNNMVLVSFLWALAYWVNREHRYIFNFSPEVFYNFVLTFIAYAALYVVLE